MGFGPNTEDQSTADKRHKSEEPVAKLRQVEVLQSQGRAVEAWLTGMGSNWLANAAYIDVSG